METSAKTAMNVNDIFLAIGEQCVNLLYRQTRFNLQKIDTVTLTSAEGAAFWEEIFGSWGGTAFNFPWFPAGKLYDWSIQECLENLSSGQPFWRVKFGAWSEARHIAFVIGHFDLGFADVFWSESSEVKGSVMENNAIILDQSWS